MGLAAPGGLGRVRPGRLRRRRGLQPGVPTFALGAVATTLAASVIGNEVARVWRRRAAAFPAEAHEEPLIAAAETVAETAAVATRGYRDVPSSENALFNLFTSFATTLVSVRGITALLRDRRRVGPFRNVRLGRRHIHHFVPGIALTFVSGSAAIAIRRPGLESWLAIPFGIGMGLTLDESALLLELDDVYWSEEGIVSVQVALTVLAMLSAVALAERFLERGEQLVLRSGG